MAIDIVARALAIRAGTISLEYDPVTKQMSFKDAQGNIVTVPLVDFIDIYTGGTTKEIATTVESGNIIKATLVDSSIDMIKLSLTLQNTINGKLDTLTFNVEKKKLEDLINLKVDKVNGKQLSTNDFTNLEKDKLLKIEDEANKYIHPAGTNPHGTTKDDVGLGNVPNVTTDNQTPTWVLPTTISELLSGETIALAFGKIAMAISKLISHIADFTNPHKVTKTQVGLSSVDNTSDIDKPVSTLQSDAIKIVSDNLDTHKIDSGKKFDTVKTEQQNQDLAIALNTAKRTYPLADEQKLATVEGGAEVNVQSDWNDSVTTNDSFIKNKPTKVSQFINDSNFSTVAQVNTAEQNAKTYADGVVATEKGERVSADNALTTLINSRVGLPEYDPATYKITFTTTQGATFIIDLPVEKLALSYDAVKKEIYFTDAQGKISSIPLVDFVDIYVGNIGENIQTTVETGNVIKAVLLDNSIDMVKLSTTLKSVINGKLDISTYTTDKTAINNKINTEITDRTNGDANSLTVAKEYTDTQTVNKVDKVNGKQLSTNDFTNLEKTKLSGIEDGANKYVHPAGTNPHGTTKVDIGLENVPNVTTDNQTPTWTLPTKLAGLVSGEILTLAFGKIAKSILMLISHVADVSNPHKVTKTQIGLSSVDNTTDANKPVSTAQASAIKVVSDGLNTHKTESDTKFDTIKSQQTAQDSAIALNTAKRTYSLTDEQKLATIENGAEVNVQSDWNDAVTTNDSFIKNKPTKVSQFTNDSNFSTVTQVGTAEQNAKTYADNIVSTEKTERVASDNAIITSINSRVGLPTYDPATYKITFTTTQGATAIIDLPIEKLGLTYDAVKKEIIFTDAQGKVVSIPLADFVDIYTGSIGTNVQVIVDTGNVIKATLLDGSVDMAKLSTSLKNIINGKLDTSVYTTDKTAINSKIDTEITDRSNGDANTLSSAKTYTDNQVANKVDKVNGKQLSTNDFTNIEKTKLNGVEDGANKYVHPAGTNPHGTTKVDIGLGNVPNVTTNLQTPTFTQATARANIISGETISVIFGKIMRLISDLKNVAFSADYRDLSNVPTIPTTLPPSGTAGGDLSGTYPNPSVNDNSHYHIIENVSGLQGVLNAKPTKSVVYDVNIGTSWNGGSLPFTQSFNISGVTPTNIIEIAPRINITETQLTEMGALILSDGGQSSNSITLKCFGKKNTSPIPIIVIVRGDRD